jgi:DNA polymerase-3 subunit epsilon
MAAHSVEDKKLAKKVFNQQKQEAPQSISLDMLKGLQDKFKK